MPKQLITDRAPDVVRAAQPVDAGDVFLKDGD